MQLDQMLIFKCCEGPFQRNRSETMFYNEYTKRYKVVTVSRQLTMRLFVFVSSIIIFAAILLVPNVFAKGTDDQQLIDAGCKFDMNERYGGDVPRWYGWGMLLQNGACIEDTYSTTIVPEKGITKAYCTKMPCYKKPFAQFKISSGSVIDFLSQLK